MRAVAVADLQEGMLVGKTLVDDTGRVLLHQGIVLNAQGNRHSVESRAGF
jgi:hypothetical protein